MPVRRRRDGQEPPVFRPGLQTGSAPRPWRGSRVQLFVPTARTAWSAGLRPASRGSAKPAPMTPRYTNADSAPRSHCPSCGRAPALAAMHIGSIELVNSRVFRGTELRWLPGVAIVAGGNGPGKSTLLDVFRFLQEALAANAAATVVQRRGFREAARVPRTRQPGSCSRCAHPPRAVGRPFLLCGGHLAAAN